MYGNQQRILSPPPQLPFKQRYAYVHPGMKNEILRSLYCLNLLQK